MVFTMLAEISKEITQEEQAAREAKALAILTEAIRDLKDAGMLYGRSRRLKRGKAQYDRDLQAAAIAYHKAQVDYQILVNTRIIEEYSPDDLRR
jgi:hypothetical protein